ncbi:hypothetical protein [Sphingomonas morindae]|uniref:Uncharacterized protein n=1 Tax=Sphingomonas morindae TaxID=1541170 RepID=A0ABY4X9S1_9SPHN|nr:hypothetical protein [Sphingomonas morindae]USI73693.1 hypothetical protein LHA26_04270 [Sphingomonas morindae]
MADQDQNQAAGRAPEADEAVAPYVPGAPEGERQDGPGIAPPRPERTDATPVGSTAERRRGPRQGHGGDDPFVEEAGEPADFKTGAARGSGAGAGGGGAGETEQPDPDSMSGGGPQS